MASSSTSSIQKSFKYDVFLSFRGEDTRKNFIDHLYHALTRKGINTYKDDESINKGKKIRDELIRSIEDSKFYIIVFSENYASSSWCLEELVKIMECQKMDGHTAYPVFFDVEPTEIRKQSGSVTNENAAGEWRDALKEAADLAGWELKNTTNGHEAKLIQQIVEKISLDLRCIDLTVDEKLVGMENRVKDVVSSLEIDVDDVRMIGIKGMGGSGKTTLARAVFDQLSIQFEGSSFVENVREVSNDSSNAIISLQKQVLSDVLNDRRVSVSGASDGKNKLKKMMRSRKVLLVLDDVDHINQLEALAGEPNWFKTGSRIIITTRDEQALVAHRVNFISDVNLLSHEEAICLFSRYAFGKEIPIQGYEELSQKVIHYAAGLPLTVKVLGSFLCGKSDDEWIDALERLKTIPLKETLQKLELSYNGLEEDYKEIFLDVVCILKGRYKDHAIRALESCGFHAKTGLKVLEQKSLITVTKYGYLGMHDHIEEMGKNIVRRLHPNEPHKHSRLWINKEVEDILSSDSGTEATRCIKLENMKLNSATVMTGLGSMKKLRCLFMDGFSHYFGEFDEDSRYLPYSLRFLSWYGYSFTCLPKICLADTLVGLQMRRSAIVQLWEAGERKVLNKLRFLDLCFSKLRTLDLGLIPNLETLLLQHCDDLVEVNMRFGCQKLKFLDLRYSKLRALDLGPTPNLEVLSLEHCKSFVELHMHGERPNLKSLNLSYSMLRDLDLGKTPNLQVLLLEHCTNLVKLHMHGESLKLKSLKLSFSKLRTLDLARTPNLEMLYLYGCDDLGELHMPVESLKWKSLTLTSSKLRTVNLARTPYLETLSLRCCYNLEKLESVLGSICGLRCLKELTLEGSFPEVPKDLHHLECLEELVLSSTKIKHLPNSICMLKHLKVLNLEFCYLLERLPDDLGRLESLEELYLSSTRVKDLPTSICTFKHLKVLRLEDCCLIEQLPQDLGGLECLEKLVLSFSKIKHLPNSICMLKHLRVLNLNRCNSLLELPEDLGRLECLEELILTSTKIKHLPNSSCMLKHLKVLNLGFCYLLDQLPEDLGKLESLEKLYIGDCLRLREIPNSIGKLKRLKYFHLCDCLLVKKLPEELGRVECLEELNIKGTGIRHLPQSISQLECLRIIGQP